MTKDMDYFRLLYKELWFANIIVSLLWVCGVLLTRTIALKVVGRFNVNSIESRRRWVLQIRNSSYMLISVGLFIIWATQLKSFAVTLIAILVALVIATKEVILCVMGSFYKSSNSSFSLGDRIEIDNTRGDVIDETLLGTTLLEVGPTRHSQQYTGRAVIIPNSRFLTGLFFNESYLDRYKIHSITVPMKLDDDWERAERLLLQAAKEHADCFVEAARVYFLKLRQTEGIDPPAVEPRVILSLPEPDRIDLIARIAVPPRQEATVVQNVLHRYLHLVRKATPQSAKS